MTAFSDNPQTGVHEWTLLAHLLRPQGRKGEILAELHTDFPDRLDGGRSTFLAAPGFAGPSKEARAIRVLSHWLPVGRNHGRIVLRFEAIDSIELAQKLCGLDLVIPASERAPLEDDDAEYISDLIGCTVFDRGQPIGQVTGVDFATSPDGARRLTDAAPLLTVEDETGKEILIPYVQAFIVSLAPELKRIEMNLPEGLVELNR